MCSRRARRVYYTTSLEYETETEKEGCERTRTRLLELTTLSGLFLGSGSGMFLARGPAPPGPIAWCLYKSQSQCYTSAGVRAEARGKRKTKEIKF